MYSYLLSNAAFGVSLFILLFHFVKKKTHIHSHTKGIYLRYNGTWNDKTIFVVLLSDLYCCGGGQLKATISVFSGTVYAN